MARPRKPTNVLELNGAMARNPGRHADRKGEPVIVDPLGPPPEFLDAPARMAWLEIERIAPWLRSADRLMVELAAQLMALFRAAGAMHTGAGLVGRLESILGKLGLNPGDRSRLNVTGPQGPNKFARRCEYDDL